MSDPGTKAALRREMKVRREELAARDPDAGEALTERFPMKLLARYGPETAGYLAIGSEIDAGPLMARLAEAGARLSLPRVTEAGGMAFHRWRPGDGLEAGPFGLKQPEARAPEVSPTLVLTPLLAFDRAGTRLGYGKGHYDRALAKLRAQGRVFTCALAYQGQMVDALPDEPHDIPLDWAVTEAGSVPLFMMRTLGGAPGEPQA